MKTRHILSILIVSLGFIQSGFSQGEALFKAKCNTCHAVDKNSTGPLLKGVKQKWNDAGEGELLYKWVQNSKGLIASGASKLANEIQNFSPSEMPPQQATNAEIDQILDYVDNYVKPAETAAAPADSTGVETEILLKPNYEKNLNLFYGLLIVLVVLLFAIILLTTSIRTLIKSDIFKTKLQEKEASKATETIKKVATVLVVGFALFTPLQSFAIDFVHGGESAEKSLWLIVENADLYALVTIDLILLFVVIYLKNLFNSFFYMAFPKPVIEKKVRVKKITKVLTDTVAIEDEASILMDHEYDGIQELDNNLPPWWVWGFYMTIVFAVAYMFHYHFLKTGDLQIQAYQKEMVQAQKDVDEYLKSQAMNVDENNVTKLEDPAALATGKTLFTTNCTVCHKEGQGDIGPNLTDKFWLYGNDIKDVFLSVKNGRPNGMPEHTSKMNPIEMQQVASYVLSLKYNAGREPQGKEYK